MSYMGSGLYSVKMKGKLTGIPVAEFTVILPLAGFRM